MHHYCVTCPNCAAEFLPGQAVTTRPRTGLRWWYAYSHVSETRCPECQTPLRFTGWGALGVAITLLVAVAAIGERILKPWPFAVVAFIIGIAAAAVLLFRYVARTFVRANHRDA